MPQLRSVFEESYRQLDEMIGFTRVEERYGRPSQWQNPRRRARRRHFGVQDTLHRHCHTEVHALRLRRALRLMHDTGFELVDMFLCCKFARAT